MQANDPLQSYPETTDDRALGPASSIGLGEPPDGLENLRIEAPPASFSGHAERPGSTGGAPAEPAGRAAAPGLVLEGESAEGESGVGWTLRTDECPHLDALAVDVTTGEIAWRPTCKNARCPRCSRQVSAQTFALARRALDPEAHVVEGLPVERLEPLTRVRFITLTQVPEGWGAAHRAMRVWRDNLDRHGVAGQTLYVLERGDQTGMKHAHVVQHGPRKIPMDVLDASWPYGMTQIESAREAVDYLAKGVVRYVAKGLDGDAQALTDHMNLNGGRAAHWSRSFFCGEGRQAFARRNPLPGVYFVRNVH